MKLLVDTQLLVWTSSSSHRLSPAGRAALGDPLNSLLFSVASIWEVAIKGRLNRQDFRVDPRLLRRGLLHAGFTELPIFSAHALAVADLPLIHRDPFDRLMLAQALTEGLTLLTADQEIGKYPAPVWLV